MPNYNYAHNDLHVSGQVLTVRALRTSMERRSVLDRVLEKRLKCLNKISVLSNLSELFYKSNQSE